MNIRLIKYSTLGMLFALAASCADEELIQTSGYRDGEAVTLSFNISVPAETEVAVTRATDSENKVNDKDLTLLVFSENSGEGVLEQVCTSYDKGPFANTGIQTDDGADDTHKKFTVTLEASKEEKAIYILANAGYLLFERSSDNFTLEIDKTTLKDLRDLQTYETPPNFIMSGCKVLPIPHADLMTQDAQNKLLKTLEEPPEGVTIFLGVANEAGVLETVKSRCRKLYIDVFDRETVYNALTSLHCPAENAAIAAACCEGQLGKARLIAFSPEYGNRYSDALTLLERLKKSRDVLDAESVPSLRSGENEFLKVLTVVLRDITSAKEGAPLFFGAELAGRIERLAEGFSLRALALSVEAVARAQEKLSFSVNPTAVIDGLLFDILEVKYKWR